GIPVVHGVAAGLRRVGRLHHDVAAQVRHLAAVVTGPQVLALQRPVEGEPRTVDALDDALFGTVGTAVHADVVGELRGCEDDPVAGPPAGDGLGKCHRAVAGPGGGAELDPGVIHRGAVEIHAAAAANDRGARLPVHALEGDEPDERGVPGADGVVG